MRQVAAVLALAAAVAVPSASAKVLTAVVVVGANGRAVTVTGSERLLDDLHPLPFAPAAPAGGYVRLYALMPGGMPMTVGRYYGAPQVACFGWRGDAGNCERVAPPLAARLAAPALAPFTRAPTYLASLTRPGVPGGESQTLVQTFDLALARTVAARPAARPRTCRSVFVARWAGPDAARRPTRLCVVRAGLYARGRIHPLPAAAFEFA